VSTVGRVDWIWDLTLERQADGWKDITGYWYARVWGLPPPAWFGSSLPGSTHDVISKVLDCGKTQFSTDQTRQITLARRFK
jgi:hypothetical protein